jgi:septal ring factor EnvC (AmiA/AmiB activator)
MLIYIKYSAANINQETNNIDNNILLQTCNQLVLIVKKKESSLFNDDENNVNSIVQLISNQNQKINNLQKQCKNLMDIITQLNSQLQSVTAYAQHSQLTIAQLNQDNIQLYQRSQELSALLDLSLYMQQIGHKPQNN